MFQSRCRRFDQFLRALVRNFSLFVKLSCQGNSDLISSHFINKARNSRSFRLIKTEFLSTQIKITFNIEMLKGMEAAWKIIDLIIFFSKTAHFSSFPSLSVYSLSKNSSLRTLKIHVFVCLSSIFAWSWTYFQLRQDQQSLLVTFLFLIQCMKRR